MREGGGVRREGGKEEGGGGQDGVLPLPLHRARTATFRRERSGILTFPPAHLQLRDELVVLRDGGAGLDLLHLHNCDGLGLCVALNLQPLVSPLEVVALYCHLLKLLQQLVLQEIEAH